MRSSRVVTLILSILTFAFLSKANETPTAELIPVIDGASRHYLTFENELNDLILQELKPGETYKVFLHKEVGDCLPVFNNPKPETDVVLLFRAEGTEQLIQILRPCDTSVDARLSVACVSCEKENDARNLMGIMVDETYPTETLVQDIFIGGDCFDVEEQSIVYEGSNLGSGFFTNGGSSINIEEGIILSTGNVHSSAGPNSVYNTGNSFFNVGNDPDLIQMINSTSIYDVASLEFDFTPTTDQISFDFVFASEEYCEYAGSSFNDVFGFFISGPGINGPFSNNGENIAVVPNTNAYTSINSVNHIDNPAYFVNNIPTHQHDDIPTYLQCEDYPITVNGDAINDIEYDGFTTVMTAMANVQACETYHIKLIIADVADGYFDSAVFLKANSFSAGELANITTEAPGGADADIAYEACDEGYFVFERITEDLSEPLEINFGLSNLSTATPNVDYEALPTSITIPIGDSVFYLPVTVYDDLLIEGTETIVLELEAPCSCDQPYILMYLEDVEPLAVVADDVFFCDPAPITIEPLITGGWGNYTFLWNTGDTTAMLDVFVDNDATYTLVVTDDCGNTASYATNVGIINPPTALISGDELVCPEFPNAQLVVEFTGLGPWDFSYTIDNVLQPIVTGIQDNPFVLETSSLGTFELQTVNNTTCNGTVQGLGTVNPVNLAIAFETTDETCPGAENGTINITPTGGAAPYNFQWDNGAGMLEDPSALASGIYGLTLTDDNGCFITTQIQVNLDQNVPVANAGQNQMLDCNNTTATLSGTASNGNDFTYQWVTSDGNIISGENTLTPTVDQTGTYNLRVTNTTTNCMVSDKTEVFIDTIAPVAMIDVLGPLVLDCSDPTTSLDASGSAPFGDLAFQWTTTDGNILSGAMSVNPEVNAGGTYELTITSNTNGCTDTEDFYIGSNMELPEINIQPTNLLTCLDSVITIDATNSSSGANYSILWTTDDGNIINDANTLSPVVDQPGTYSMTIFNTSNDCENTASVIVTEDRIPPIANAGLPTELGCNDASTILDGSESSLGPNFIYQWSTNDGTIQSGTESPNPEITTAGIYELLVINIRNGCTASDAVQVIEDPDVPNAADIEIFAPECFGEVGTIAIPTVYGGEAPYVYSIDGGESFFSENIFLNLEPGYFNVLIQDAEGCLYEEAIEIPGVPELTVDVIADVEISLGDTYQLQANSSIPEVLLDTIIWTPEQTLSCIDCLEPIAFPLETTTYEVTVMDENGCLATDQIQVRVDKDRKVYIPNAFSPNGDGANDRFMIYAKEGLVTRISTFQVFNRWGGKVFEVQNAMPNDFLFGWDGTMKGKVVNPSVFIYYAEIEFIDGEKILYKGDVTVMD